MISSRRGEAQKARDSRAVAVKEDLVHLQQVGEGTFTNTEAHPASDVAST
jgi:hypothetical protein